MSSGQHTALLEHNHLCKSLIIITQHYANMKRNHFFLQAQRIVFVLVGVIRSMNVSSLLCLN